MSGRLLLFFLAFLANPFLGEGEVWGQTYTTTGNSTDWNNPASWIKTNPGGCTTPNPANVPPLGPVYAACDIRIIINHPITRTGNANIGGGNVRSITVNQGGEVTFGGNLTVNNVGAPSFLFQINDGGRFIVSGTLGIRSGATFNVINNTNLDPKTFVQVGNLTFLNAGTGQSLNVGSNTIFNVIGQTRLEGGGVLNIQGEFNTNTFNSANSGGNQVNISGSGLLKTTGNMQIDGFPMNLSGNAGVLVGGNLAISNSGNSLLNLNGPNTNFTVLSRGSSIAAGKTPSGSCFQTPENGNTCFNQACMEIISNPLSGNQFERIYIFRCSSTWTVPADTMSISTDSLEIIDSYQTLVVAGGGGGGRGSSSGGGGAGGLIYIADETFTPGQNLNIIVGQGGVGSTNTNSPGGNGGNSSIQGKGTAIGGGGGGSSSSTDSNRSGRPGGSGGGSANNSNNENIPGGSATSTNPPAITTPNNSTVYGRNGGASTANGSNLRGGGGGGAGSNGADGSRSGPNNIGGNGGAALSFNISGSPGFYAGGGGGNAVNIKGQGGSGVGGDADGSGAFRNGNSGTGSGGGATSFGNGGNGGSGIVIIRYESLRILPVEFLSFTATYQSQNRSAMLDWSTAKEWENSHFEIERAIHSVRNWEKIGEINGHGYSDSPVSYSFEDSRLPASGGNIFYRLKQVDLNGDFTYSDTKAIRVEPLPSSTYWKVYPNPSTGDPINLEMLDTGVYNDESIQVRVISSTSQFDLIQGENPRDLSSQLADILRNKPPGVYTLEISWGANREYHKVILRR